MVWLDGQRLRQVLDDQPRLVPWQVCLSRDRSGSQLFINGVGKNYDRIGRTISAHGIAARRHAVEFPILDDEGRPVAWIGEPRALVFATGDEIPLTNSVATFKFSPGGHYLLFKADPAQPIAAAWASVKQPVVRIEAPVAGGREAHAGWQAVFRTGQPKAPVFRLPDDFIGSCIFCCQNDVYVFGQRVSQARRRLGGSRGLVFHLDGEEVKLAKQLDLGKYGAVIDMDEFGTKVLIQNRGEYLLRTWGLLDLSTRRYTSLGAAKDTGFL